MQNVDDFDREIQILLDMIGSEPLAKSRLANEEPDLDYRSEQATTHGHAGNRDRAGSSARCLATAGPPRCCAFLWGPPPKSGAIDWHFSVLGRRYDPHNGNC